MRLIDAFMAGIGAGIVSWHVLGYPITAAIVIALACGIVADALADVYRERRQRKAVYTRWESWYGPRQ